MRHLLNMSQPPRTRVVAAPHRAEARGLRLDLADRLPEDGPDWHQRLCAAFGVDVEAWAGEAPEDGKDDPEAKAKRALTRLTADVLARRGAPAAAPLWEGRGRVACDDPLLALAVLSRASGRVFLARRTPRFERERLARTRVASELLLPGEGER